MSSDTLVEPSNDEQSRSNTMTDELRDAVKEAIQSIDAEQHVDGYATEYLNGDTDLSEWERNVIADAALSLMQPEIDRRVAEERERLLERLREPSEAVIAAGCREVVLRLEVSPSRIWQAMLSQFEKENSNGE